MYLKSFQITKTFLAATLKHNSSGFDGFLGSGHMKLKGHIVTQSMERQTTELTDSGSGTCGTILKY